MKNEPTRDPALNGERRLAKHLKDRDADQDAALRARVHLLMAIVVTIFLFWIVAVSAGAANKYVTKSGNDSNNGLTLETAYLTINGTHNVLTSLAAGDTLFIGAGNWDEDGPGTGECGCGTGPAVLCGTITVQTSGTAANNIVIRNVPGQARPKIFGDSTAYNRYGLHIGSTIKHVIIDSLEILRAGRGITVCGDSITILDCPVHDTRMVRTGTASNNNGGIYTDGTVVTRLIVKRCTLYDNDDRAAGDTVGIDDFNNAGGLFYRCEDCIFDSNTVYGQTNGGGVRLKGLNTRAKIRWNTFYNVGHGIYGVGWGDSVTFAYNIIRDGTGAHAIEHGTRNDNPNDSTSFAWIYNNTVYDFTAGSGIKFAFFDGGGLIYNDSVFNNIIVEARNGDEGAGRENMTTCPERTDLLGDGLYGLYWDYNCVWHPTLTDIIRWETGTAEGCAGTAQFWTLAQFQANTVHGDNSAQANPVFADTAGNNFSLTASSPAAVKTGGRGGAYPTYMGAVAWSSTTPLYSRSLK